MLLNHAQTVQFNAFFSIHRNMQPLPQSILEHFCHFVRNLYPLAGTPTLSPLVPTLSNFTNPALSALYVADISDA